MQLPYLPALNDADSCDDMAIHIKIYNAMIRFFFKENPEKLSDIEFVERIRELRFLADEGFLRGIKL